MACTPAIRDDDHSNDPDCLVDRYLGEDLYDDEQENPFK